MLANLHNNWWMIGMALRSRGVLLSDKKTCICDSKVTLLTEKWRVLYLVVLYLSDCAYFPPIKAFQMCFHTFLPPVQKVWYIAICWGLIPSWTKTFIRIFLFAVNGHSCFQVQRSLLVIILLNEFWFNVDW